MRVIGTNALFCHEAAAGVRIEQEHLATEDLDILWGSRNHLTLATCEKLQPSGLLGILKAVDRSFELKSQTELYTAVNKDGYQVDVLRREGAGSDRESEVVGNSGRRAGTGLLDDRATMTPKKEAAMNAISKNEWTTRFAARLRRLQMNAGGVSANLGATSETS